MCYFDYRNQPFKQQQQRVYSLTIHIQLYILKDVKKLVNLIHYDNNKMILPILLLLYMCTSIDVSQGLDLFSSIL